MRRETNTTPKNTTQSPPAFVVGFDFEDHSLPALDQAIRFASTWPNSKLIVVWASAVARRAGDEEERDALAKRKLDELDSVVRRRMGLFEQQGIRIAHTHVTLRVAEGAPDEALRRTAFLESADVIVVGTSSKNTLEGLVLGSVSRSLVTSSPCSVLVSRPPSQKVQLDPPPAPGEESTLGRRHTYSYESRVGQPGTTMPLVYPMN